VRDARDERKEIEAALYDHPSVTRAAVAVAGTGASGPRLSAYVVASTAAPPDAAALRAFLLDRLPEPIVLSAFFRVDALPATPSGKVDRRALPPAVALTAPSEAPQGPIEEAAAAAWRELLGREDFGVHDTLFALGGHSLLAVRVLTRLADRFGVEVPLPRFFRGSTVAELAAVVAEMRTSTEGEAGVEELLAELERLSEHKTRALLAREGAVAAPEDRDRGAREPAPGGAGT
jgi:acyl carrier protein